MKILESYKKMAKSMLTEHAWDRKFGESLPTLEDTIKKHQTEADRPGEPDPQKAPGKVWKGQDGNWVAWNKKDPSPTGKEYGIKSKKAAEKQKAKDAIDKKYANEASNKKTSNEDEEFVFAKK